jgi:hypothetical protein
MTSSIDIDPCPCNTIASCTTIGSCAILFLKISIATPIYKMYTYQHSHYSIYQSVRGHEAATISTVTSQWHFFPINIIRLTITYRYVTWCNVTGERRKVLSIMTNHHTLTVERETAHEELHRHPFSSLIKKIK